MLINLVDEFPASEPLELSEPERYHLLEGLVEGGHRVHWKSCPDGAVEFNRGTTTPI